MNLLLVPDSQQKQRLNGGFLTLKPLKSIKGKRRSERLWTNKGR